MWGGAVDVDMQQASWITGLLSIGCFVGCVLAGPVMERLGRRSVGSLFSCSCLISLFCSRPTLMFVASGLYALGFILIALATTAEIIFAGRFLNGAGLGVVLATVSVYIVEIATTDMRGFLGCFVQVRLDN